MTIKQCADFIRQAENALILTHRRPDGDAIGSGGAICHILRHLGKTAYLFDNEDFLELFEDYTRPLIAPKDFTPGCIIAVDLAAEGLFPKGFSGSVDLSIDHHPSNSFYAENTLLDFEKASCGEIIQQLAEELEVPLFRELADCLYIAISTDTGCFAYSNVTADTLRSAAKLIDAGVDNAALNKYIFRSVSKARLDLEAMIYSGLETYEKNGRLVVFATITNEMMEKAGATENDCQDISALAGRLKNSAVSATFREGVESGYRVSLRSGSLVDASAVCQKFGGGGHTKAAGCTINQPLDIAKKLLLDEIYKAI
ncbi:bifunctional oligoribonuclease/PAP phosphatase NrnA [Clostridiaceae bacterium OttesenSCG-928-D20]|nr:bifunctional oligoribonuclease/PAP phosphatase NrnA [Clostridiaceae bacterium OttesenSCG-928-D20]